MWREISGTQSLGDASGALRGGEREIGGALHALRCSAASLDHHHPDAVGQTELISFFPFLRLALHLGVSWAAFGFGVHLLHKFPQFPLARLPWVYYTPSISYLEGSGGWCSRGVRSPVSVFSSFIPLLWHFLSTGTFSKTPSLWIRACKQSSRRLRRRTGLASALRVDSFTQAETRMATSPALSCPQPRLQRQDCTFSRVLGRIKTGRRVVLAPSANLLLWLVMKPCQPIKH
ncbi:hypothetical protein HDK90DRAFT_11516 [Phyllosticta capitalensis]|uniref:Uncharacterized protein n=1 Tax=Phyllosticta capitalensis TaxID=121624 RepID=A0ABR1Z261_9PEZI